MTTSSLGRKQRKSLYNLPWHKRRKHVSARLETKLTEKYHIRSLPVRKGDTVKIIRGDADTLGQEAKVAFVNITEMKIVVEGITIRKADGKEKQRFVEPSNVLLTKLDLSDPARRRRIEKRGKLADGEVKDEKPEPKVEKSDDIGKEPTEDGDKEDIDDAEKPESDEDIDEEEDTDKDGEDSK